MLNVGDLVRIRDDGMPWHQVAGPRDRVGIVTAVRELVHDPSGESYTAVTVSLGSDCVTLAESSFELISKTERKKI